MCVWGGGGGGEGGGLKEFKLVDDASSTISLEMQKFWEF